MKINKFGLMALLAAGSLLSFSPGLLAQEQKQDSKPADSTANQRPQRGRGASVENRLAQLSEQLKLTDEQKPKVKALLEEQAKQRTEYRDLSQEERRTKMRAAREEMNKKMKAILTDEQYKKWETSNQGRARRGRANAGGQNGNNSTTPNQ